MKTWEGMRGTLNGEIRCTALLPTTKKDEQKEIKKAGTKPAFFKQNKQT
jgi:hypothetical protein